MPGRDRDRNRNQDHRGHPGQGQARGEHTARGERRAPGEHQARGEHQVHGRDRHQAKGRGQSPAQGHDRGRGQVRDRFSTATRLRLLGQQTAARVYRSQSRRQARRSRLTGRAAVLVLVLCSLIVALAYPIRQYVSQRAEIGDMRRQRAADRARVERLRDLKARWQDDSYAEQQIRKRLHYVRPGETGYLVIQPGSDQQSGGHEDTSTPAGQPWYATMWETVDRSDRTGGTSRPAG
jgi:cell division protein FtsB